MVSVKIKDMDHIVLNVADAERSLEFYIETLGLKGERVQEFRARTVGFPSVRINAHTLIDLNPKGDVTTGAGTAESNLDHFCLVMEKVDLSDVLDYLTNKGVKVLTGPVSRWGARGRATSIYILDPDDNQVELRCY